MELLFIVSTAVVIYAALLYPAALVALGALRRAAPVRPGHTPPVSVIIAASNEAEHLREKLEQTLRLAYPPGLLQVVVAVDDGSGERTVEIARSFEPRGVVVCHSAVRGKNASMDLAVVRATGEILVFTDATGRLSDDAVVHLAAPFRDPRVGCVGGRLLFRGRDEPMARVDGLYWRVERALYRGCAVLGYVPSTPGTIHALRRSVYAPVGNHFVRDVVDPAQAAAQGYRVVLEERAECLEVPWTGVGETFRNRIRTTMRCIAATPYILGGFVRGRRWTAWVQFVSHKVLRQQIWLPLSGMLASSLWLAPGRPLFATAAALQLGGYALAAAGLLAAARGRRIPVLCAAGFLLLNLAAMAVASFRSLAGGRVVVWRREPAAKGSAAHA